MSARNPDARAALDAELRALLDVLEGLPASRTLEVAWVLLEKCHAGLENPGGFARMEIQGTRAGLTTTVPAVLPPWLERLYALAAGVEDLCLGRAPR